MGPMPHDYLLPFLIPPPSLFPTLLSLSLILSIPIQNDKACVVEKDEQGGGPSDPLLSTPPHPQPTGTASDQIPSAPPSSPPSSSSTTTAAPAPPKPCHGGANQIRKDIMLDGAGRSCDFQLPRAGSALVTALALVVPGCFLSQGVVVWRRVGFSLGFPQLTEHCMVWPRFP
jgi:hypothetical protein